MFWTSKRVRVHVNRQERTCLANGETGEEVVLGRKKVAAKGDKRMSVRHLFQLEGIEIPLIHLQQGRALISRQGSKEKMGAFTTPIASKISSRWYSGVVFKTCRAVAKKAWPHVSERARSITLVKLPRGRRSIYVNDDDSDDAK